MLIGMLAPSEGQIQFDGEPLDAHHRKTMAHVRQRAQLVFQDPYSALNPKLTVGSALSEVLLHRGMSKEEAQKRCRSLLEEVGLSAEDAAKRPGQFSGGQRQRLVIARALAVEPEFLVLDESVAALDVQIQREILDLLAQIGDLRGLTYLFISHDLAVVASFCERLLIMENGRIVETGKNPRNHAKSDDDLHSRITCKSPGESVTPPFVIWSFQTWFKIPCRNPTFYPS